MFTRTPMTKDATLARQVQRELQQKIVLLKRRIATLKTTLAANNRKEDKTETNDSDLQLTLQQLMKELQEKREELLMLQQPDAPSAQDLNIQFTLPTHTSSIYPTADLFAPIPKIEWVKFITDFNRALPTGTDKLEPKKSNGDIIGAQTKNKAVSIKQKPGCNDIIAKYQKLEELIALITAAEHQDMAINWNTTSEDTKKTIQENYDAFVEKGLLMSTSCFKNLPDDDSLYQAVVGRNPLQLTPEDNQN